VYGKVPDTDEARRAIKPTGRFEKVFDNMMLDHNVDMDRTTGRRGVLVVSHGHRVSAAHCCLKPGHFNLGHWMGGSSGGSQGRECAFVNKPDVHPSMDCAVRKMCRRREDAVE
jgi:hypothetical protein